ncbi:MAG: hypothetical protein IT373_04710 [Polyangiaceae bacterium]|nr:hypothetical protein [Polyangiaceae bacterium]
MNTELLPHLHLPPAWSAAAVLLCALPYLGALVGALRRARRHGRTARSEERSFDPEAMLVAGDVVVTGRVEYAEGAELAVRVEVVQSGTESESSGSWSHSWTERARRVRVHPFYLRLASGERVRVEPADDALLVDALDGMVLVNRTERIRTAELSPGEQVFVRGTLGRGADPEGERYRSGRALVLRATPGHRMLVSSEPLGARFRKRQRTYRRWAVAALVCLCAVQASFFSFHALAFGGRTVPGTVEARRAIERTDSEGDPYTDYEVDVLVALPDAPSLRFTEEVSEGDYALAAEGSPVAVRHVQAVPSLAELGTGGTVHGVRFALVLPLGLAFYSIYAGARRRSRPWYLRPVKDTGSGQLPDVPA